MAADNPHATPFLIHTLVDVAEHERNMISSRTKAALEAARRRGVKLGNPRYESAISKAVEVRQKIAADRNAGLRKMVAEVMEKTGLATRGSASWATADGLLRHRVNARATLGITLAEERHGRAVLDGLLEVADGNVIAEHVLRPFLAAATLTPSLSRWERVARSDG